jgi:hypothetical protein
VTWFWVLVVPILIVLAALTLIDMFRRGGRSGGAMAAWTVFIVCLPVIGAFTYWITRKPPEDEAEQAYLAQTDLRRESQRLPIDRSGL